MAGNPDAARPVFESIEAGQRIPELVRVTDLAHWNRYAAINDEFIPIHMDPAAAHAVGQPDVFGMGNLRVAYLHAMLDDWLGDAGDVAAFECQFRGFNFKGDELEAAATVTGSEQRDGLQLVHVDLAVHNQREENTTPGTATLVLFRDGKAAMPAAAPAGGSGEKRERGVWLDDETLSWLGRSTEPYQSLPVGANDIRRWSMAVHYPEPSPARYYDEAVAKQGAWGGLVAPRDFNPFAWMQGVQNRMPWMRGVGTEPGERILNGGQRSLHFERIRPGDVITAQLSLTDAYERDGRLGTMLFLITETRWTNQDGKLVRLGYMTTIYY